ELKRKREELRRLGMTQSGDNSADLEALRGDVAQLESLVKKMADRIDLLNVEPLPPPPVSVLEPAEAPQAKNQERQLKLAGAGATAASARGLAGVCSGEVRRRKTHAPSDVVESLGLSLVGTVPALPVQVRAGTPGATPRDQLWQQRLNESVDAIRTQLLHAA